TELAHRLTHQSVHVLPAPDVALHKERFADALRRRLAARLRVLADHDHGAFTPERVGNGQSVARATTGDNRHPPIQPAHGRLLYVESGPQSWLKQARPVWHPALLRRHAPEVAIIRGQPERLGLTLADAQGSLLGECPRQMHRAVAQFRPSQPRL